MRAAKSVLAGLLMISILINFLVIMFPASEIPVVGWGGYVNESTTELGYSLNASGAKAATESQKPSTLKIVEKRTKNFEYSLVLIGLSLLILLLPWIKSFQAGAIKMDLKETPTVVTGGAGYPLGPPRIEM